MNDHSIMRLERRGWKRFKTGNPSLLSLAKSLLGKGKIEKESLSTARVNLGRYNQTDEAA